MRRLSAVAISLIVSAAGLVGTVGPAEAASPAQSNGVVSLSASGRSTSGGMSVQVVITCTISVDNPHHSSHEPTTVRVFGRISCTAPVSALWSTVSLIRNAAIVGTNANSNTGSAALANAVVTPCVNGTYLGMDEGFVLFPPGFVPPGGFITASSPLVPIASCP